MCFCRIHVHVILFIHLHVARLVLLAAVGIAASWSRRSVDYMKEQIGPLHKLIAKDGHFLNRLAFAKAVFVLGEEVSGGLSVG